MTVQELSQLYWLRKEVEVNRQQMADLKELGAAFPHIIDEVKECYRIRARLQRSCMDEVTRLENYIDSIKDEFIQELFIARYRDGNTWEMVAKIAGPGYERDAVRKSCERYLSRSFSEKCDGFCK